MPEESQASVIQESTSPEALTAPTQAVVALTGTKSTISPIPSESHRSSRVPELDGVRAIAVWWVLLFHLFPNSNPAVSKMPLVVRQIISHGWLGVDLFFVLSGFLITGILLESRTKPAYFKNFYGRRALRILPVYVSAIVAMWICYHSFSTFFLLSLAFLANFNNLLHVAYPLGGAVFWSLAVEEHFYLVWPVLIRFTRTGTLVAAGVVLVVAETTIRGLCMARGIDTYELSWFRFDSLAFGALIAVFFRSRYSSPRNCIKLVTALVFVIAAITAASAPFGGLTIGSPVSSTLRYAHGYVSFGAAILLLSTFSGHWLTGIFRSSFVRVSADLSYCVYLIHLAILDAYYKMVGPTVTLWLRSELTPFGEGIFSATAILATTFLLAFLSRRFLETPFLRLKNQLV